MSILKEAMSPRAALYSRSFDGTLHPLNSNGQDLPILVRSDLGGEYCYVPQNEKVNGQNIFRSVSNILKLTQDDKSKENLRKWEARIGKDKAKQIRDEAIHTGNAVHSFIHAHITGKKPRPIKKRHQPYLQALNKVMPNYGQALLSEQIVVSLEHQYFGKIDQLGLYKESLTLSDIKTSLKPKNSLDWIHEKILQLAAYYIPIEALYPIEQAALIYLISDGSFDEFIFTSEQMSIYKELWLERLSQIEQVVSLVA